MQRKGAGHAEEAHPCRRGLTFPTWHLIPSAMADNSLWTQGAAVTPGETEAKGLICRNMSPDLPNSRKHQLIPSLHRALLPPCRSRGITTPQSPLPSLAGTSEAVKPSILPQLPRGPGTSSSSTSSCPVKAHPCVLLIAFPAKGGGPAGICPFQPQGCSQRPAVPAPGTLPRLQPRGVQRAARSDSGAPVTMGTLNLLACAQVVSRASDVPFPGGIAPLRLPLTSAKCTLPKGCAHPASGDEA